MRDELEQGRVEEAVMIYTCGIAFRVQEKAFNPLKHFRTAFLSVFLLLFLGFSWGTVLAAAPLPSMSLYDDFSGTSINAAKWQNLEIVREIRGGRLISNFRAAGPPSSQTSPPSNDLQFANPSAIQSFQTDARLNAYTAPADGISLVLLGGSYYNDGTSGSGAMGDVRAQLYLRGMSGGVDIRYRVYKCTDADCTTGSTVIPTTTVKSAALGELHTLGIAWNGSVFTFAVDGVDVVVDPKPFQPIVKSVPNVAVKALSTALSFTGSGGEGDVSGDFDNVVVNGVPYDDFSGSRLDPARWRTLEVVREVSGGHLVSKVGGTGAAGNTTLVKNRSRFVNQNAVVAIKTDVTITDYQTTGAFAQVMLLGAFYNDGSSTGGFNDSTGDIEAWLRIGSSNNNAPQLELGVDRCNNPSCDTQTMLFSDRFGTINVGESHTLVLAWDGSVFTYGIDSDIRLLDPKPSASIVKPPQSVTRDIRTWVTIQQNGGHGYIAVTFDNVYVNDKAVTPPRLAPFLQQSVQGDVASAGVGLRGVGSGTITLSGIPAGATVEKAFLYWATLGIDGTFTSPTLNNVAVVGSLIGTSDDPLWGAAQSYAYRADVTSLVSGNGSYTIAGLPALGPAVNDSQGASLVVMYTQPGAPSRMVTINDGAVTLSGARLQYYKTTLSGFVAADPPAGATLTFLVADGQSGTPEYAGLGTTPLATNEFSGSNGNYWDTRSYDVSSALLGGATQADAIVSTGGDSLVWVAAILSVPGGGPIPATLTSPAPGSTLPGATVPFTWTSGTGVSAYYLAIGSSPGGEQYHGQYTTARSDDVSNLPTDGRTLYVRLYSLLGGSWLFNDYTFPAASPQKAVLTVPIPGNTLRGAIVTFTWTPGSLVSAYYLAIGSSPGGEQYHGQYTTARSDDVSNLPTDGRTLYVRLYSLIGGSWSFNDYTYTAATIINQKATLTSPTPGSTLPGASVPFTWTSGTGVSAYYLAIGNSAGGEEWCAKYTTAQSWTCSGLPTDGRTLYVRLYSLLGGSWLFNDYTYTAATIAVLTSPPPGSTLPGATVTFSWTSGTGVTAYYLAVGSSPGGEQYYGQYTTAQSATVPGLPTDGRTLYVRLYSLIGGSWPYNDYTYTAPCQVQLISPPPGSTLPGATVTFTWTSCPGVTAYYLAIGSSPGGEDVYGRYVPPPDVQPAIFPPPPITIVISGLPTDGRTLYVRLYSRIGGSWPFNDYTVTAATIINQKAALTSPTPGSILPGATVPFTWTSGTGVSAYYLAIGSSPGGEQYYGQYTTTQSATVPGLPTDGRTLYVRLYSRIGGSWPFNDYTVTAATIINQKAALTSPTPGSILPGATVPFTWTSGTGVSAYYLAIGSSLGGEDWCRQYTTAQSWTCSGLPTDGRTLYVRLYSLIGGSWPYTDYTYTAASGGVPNILGTYTGSGSLTQSACSIPANNGGPFTFTASITIASQTGSSFTGTGTLYTGLVDQGTVVTGTITAAGQLSGTFTFTAYAGSTPIWTGSGSFTGSLVGNTLTLSFSAQVQTGETCHVTGSLTATR